jgi:hypothetical protein
VVPSTAPQLRDIGLVVATPFSAPASVAVARATDPREHVVGARLRDKSMLRYAFADILPPLVAWHRKIGYADQQIEQALILRKRDEIRSMLGSPRMVDVGVDAEEVDLDTPGTCPIERLLVLASWLEEWDARRRAAESGSAQ